MSDGPRVLYLEPYDGGSHAAFTRTLLGRVPARWTPLTLSGHHWKWRMRGAVPYWALAEADALAAPYDVLWASAYVPLAELFGVAPALAQVPSVLYFHENQLAYPVQDRFHKARDHHYGVSQLLAGLAATRLVFNSAHNRDTFFEAAQALLRALPKPRPPGWLDRLRAKSEVLPLLLDLADEAPAPAAPPHPDGPLLLWNHRWEHDKAPEDFAQALLTLHARGHRFRVALCGQRFRETPEAFTRLKAALGDRVLCFGDQDRAAYAGWLRRADLALSTARHEFFGIAMLEAAHAGCDVLVPDALAYPEHFGPEHRYPPGELVPALEARLARYAGGDPLRADRRDLTAPYGDALLPRYVELLARVADQPCSSRSPSSDSR